MVQTVSSTNIQDLLRNEEMNALSKIAIQYNELNLKIIEKKTFPRQKVGELALLRTYSYDNSNLLTGSNVIVSTWEQEDEDIAIPAISDIVLTAETVTDGSVAGTVVAGISCVGGVAPFTYELTVNPGNVMQIDEDNLEMAVTADTNNDPYNIEIEATDANGQTFSKQFSIEVVGFSNTKSLLFDGIDEKVVFGNKFLYDRSNQWSFSIWIKPDNTAAQYTIYSKVTNDGNVYGWGFYQLATAKIRAQVRTASSLTLHDGSLSVNVGAWNHIVITYNGGSNLNGLKIYVNGVLDTIPASATLAGTLLLGQDAMIAARNTTWYYPGRMDEMTVWNKELTTLEVSELYNSGDPTYPPEHSASANLVNWYKLGDGDTFPTITDNVGSDDGTMTNMEAGDIITDVP